MQCVWESGNLGSRNKDTVRGIKPTTRGQRSESPCALTVCRCAVLHRCCAHRQAAHGDSAAHLHHRRWQSYPAYTCEVACGRGSEAEYQSAILFPGALASSGSFCFQRLILPGAVRHLCTALSARAMRLLDGEHLAAPPDSPLYDPRNHLTWERARVIHKA